MGENLNQEEEEIDAGTVTDCFANEHISGACSPVKKKTVHSETSLKPAY